MKKIITVLLILVSMCGFSQKEFTAEKMPLFFEPLPANTAFKFVKSIFVVSDVIETDVYKFEVDEMPFLMLKTAKKVDCFISIVNNFGGGDIFKKNQNGEYQRIMEVRDNKDKYGIYQVDEDNNTEKIFSVYKVNEGGTNSEIDALYMAYGYYFKD